MRFSSMGLVLLLPSLAFADPASPEVTIVDTYNVRTNQVTWLPIQDYAILPRDDFYHLVGRDDLANDYRTHRNIALATFAGSAAFAGLAIYELVQMHRPSNYSGCTPSLSESIAQFNACFANADAAMATQNQTHETPALLSAGASIGLLGVAIYEVASLRSVSNRDAHELAARYNATHVTPYAGADGAGVTVLGRF